jgi:AcrR family transcriptional regulator
MAAVDSPHTRVRRGGQHTRREAQRVALALFTAQGYEATSLREIANALGINKASLYYHFPNKEAILRSLFEDRGSEVDDLLGWLSQQPIEAGLLETAVLRWVDSFSEDKLRGIRFLAANPLMARVLDTAGGERIGAGLNQLVDALTRLLPTPTPADVLLLRMSILSINSAVEAAADTEIPDADIITAAHTAARALVARVVGGTTAE